MASELSFDELVIQGRAALFHNKEVERLQQESQLASNREYWMAALEEIHETFPLSVRRFVGFHDGERPEYTKNKYTTILIKIPHALQITADFKLNAVWNDKTRREDDADWERKNDYFIHRPILSLSEDGLKSKIDHWDNGVGRFSELDQAIAFAIDSYQEVHKKALDVALKQFDQQKRHAEAMKRIPTIGERLEELLGEMIHERLPRE